MEKMKVCRGYREFLFALFLIPMCVRVCVRVVKEEGIST